MRPERRTDGGRGGLARRDLDLDDRLDLFLAMVRRVLGGFDDQQNAWGLELRHLGETELDGRLTPEDVTTVADLSCGSLISTIR